ncbi:phosphate/phosphite/phosphonate ABC transporter substrate-binding protein [uncultured Desulfobacter sp.]|uniref:phosphate/phosphite/phosphonate ABC transporter substrate-binding protein n=1 Tax=uncultured Desulfobacter sp. TaxID=240139 RepID=UPI002AAB1CC2|nr:phosphate/phosphite/phosphonate ABC transporter substrate-binding protein [uncultured Desulfobacter sp.]
MGSYKKLFAAALLILIAGCGDDQPIVKVDLSRTEQVTFTEEPDQITYAYLPQYSHTVSYTRHHGLINYLRQKTGLNIRQIFPDTFDQHMKMVGNRQIDISFSNPLIYVKIAQRYGAQAFAQIVEGAGENSFRGQIITRKNNLAIQSLGDCRGKRWIAVDPASAGGYLFPLGHFFKQGIFSTDFKAIDFAPGPGGKQEKVILAVFSGRYDIGTIREGALDVVAGRIDVSKIRILSRTRTYPGWVYAARKNLAPDNLNKIKNALIELDFNRQDHREILEAADFFKVVPAGDEDFYPVRELMDTLGMELTP